MINKKSYCVSAKKPCMMFIYHYTHIMTYFSHSDWTKRWYSIAEYAVLVVVLWILFAAIIPIFIRINAYKRNVQRITDIKTISQQVQNFNAKNGDFPDNLRTLSNAWLWVVPKDPQNKAYCKGAPWYTSWDYQYFVCKDCEAIWPLKTYLMKHIVQIWALMEWENERWDRNSWNRWSPYTLWDTTNCAANWIRWVWTLLEWVRWNWIWWTWSSTINILTNTIQKNYEPRYNVIISSEKK